MPKMKHAMRVQWGEGIDTIDWGKNSVCEGIVTSLHIHSRFHLLFNDRKLRANNTNNTEERSDGFEGTRPLCSMQWPRAPLCSAKELPGEHVSSLDPRLPVCPQNQGLLPTAALVHCPPAHPSLEGRDTWQAECWIPWQPLSETCCGSRLCSGCHKNWLELPKGAAFPEFAIRVAISWQSCSSKLQ